MNPDFLFELTNGIAFFSWIILIVFPNKAWTSRLLIATVILLFCFLYTFLVFTSLEPGNLSDFSTLDGLMGLFSSKTAVLAGWVHYLAFDMMAGLYIVNNARTLKINRWLLIPCMIFTFMAGPFGLLLYLILRTIVTKRYIQDYI